LAEGIETYSKLFRLFPNAICMRFDGIKLLRKIDVEGVDEVF